MGALDAAADRVADSQPLARRPKLGEEVTRILREEILTGQLAPRQRLVLEEIAQQLGVSSMPVREALAVLESEGLVDALPRRGFRVATILRQDIADVFEVHAHLSGILAHRAAQVFTDEDVSTLLGIQREIEAVATGHGESAVVTSRVEELNFAFHRHITERAEGTRLRWFLRASLRFVPPRYYLTIPGWISATLEDHPHIIDALEARDSERARQVMSDHILRGGALVLEQMPADSVVES
jgi:DNA-binding GntR family transcriptional regulator